MQAAVRRINSVVEFHTPELCFISELSNSDADADVSIAQARVPIGVTTRWHVLAGTAERYVVTSGEGRMELEGLAPQAVGRGDVVLIPSGCPQRIANTGSEDLVFLAICTPRFRVDVYTDIDRDPMPPDTAAA